MASVYDLKPKFQSLLRPTTHRLAAAGITANMVTIAAAAISIAVGAGLATFPNTPAVWWLVPITMLLRMAFNAIDGMLAREHNQKSRLGAILNEVGDVVSDAALYLPIALHDAIPPWLVVLFVLLAVLTEFIGVVSVQIGSSRRYDGPMGKSDRAFWISVLAVGMAIGWVSRVIAMGVFGFLILLLFLTVLNRGLRALEEQPTGTGRTAAGTGRTAAGNAPLDSVTS
jgi:CDP-diacylglycerol--glycerol-3-phosphate 3-phosphatidyltransferase